MEMTLRTFSVLVDDEPGVLSQISRLFSRKGFNIESLAVGPTEEHGLSRLTLEVRVSNTPAIALYEGAGFVRDGVRPGFYREPREDAAIYSKYCPNR